MKKSAKFSVTKDKPEASELITRHSSLITIPAHNAALTGYYKFETHNPDDFLTVEALAKTFGFKRIPSWRIKPRQSEECRMKKHESAGLEPEVVRLPTQAQLKKARRELFRAIGRKALSRQPSAVSKSAMLKADSRKLIAPIVTHSHYEKTAKRRRK